MSQLVRKEKKKSSLHEKMHPENLYLNGVNYDEIYRENPESRHYLYLNEKGKAQLFNTKEAQGFVTTLLLKVRF